MYSYEDRIRAVQLFLKLGKRVGATIRQLGYPTKNALKTWCREYEERQDLPTGYAMRRPKYTQEQKEAAVNHYLEHGRCLAFTRQSLGYPCRQLLVSWLNDLRPESRVRIVGTSHTARPAALKKAAVIALCTRQGAAGALSIEFGVSRPTLYNWKNQLLGREAPASMKKQPEPPPADAERQELERQLEVLRREIRRLNLEQDLLKKANELPKKGAERQSARPQQSREDSSD